MEDIESIDFCSQIYFPYSELKKDGDSHLEDLAQELVEKEENMTPNLFPKSDLEKPSKRSLTKAKDLDSPDLDSGVRTNVPQLNFNKKKKMKNVANDPFVSARQFSLKSPETDPDEPEPNGDSEISDGSGEDEREESYLSQEENVVRKENSKSKSGSMEAQKDLESDSRSVQNKGSSQAKIKPVFGCPAKNKTEKSSKSSKPRKTEAFKMASKKSKKHESEVESEDAKLLPDTILNTDEDSLFVNSNVCPVKRDSGEGEQIVPSFSRKKPKANSLGKPLHVVKTKQSDAAPQGTKGPGKKVSKKQGLSEISSSVLNSEAQHRRKEGGENNAPGGEKKSRKKTSKNGAEENNTNKCVGDIEEEKKGTPLKKKRKKTDDGVAVAETPKDKNKGPEVRSLIEDFDSELINVECLYPSLNGEIPVDPGSPTASERSEQEKKKKNNKKKRKSKDEEDEEEENEGENEVCKKSVMKKKKEKNKEGNDEGEKEGENKIRGKPTKKKKQVKEEEKKEEEENGIYKKQTKKKRKGKNEEDSQDDEGENEEGNEIGEKTGKKKKKIKEEEEEKEQEKEICEKNVKKKKMMKEEEEEEEQEKEICEKNEKKKKKIKEEEEEEDDEEEEEKEICEKTVKKKKKIKEEEENEICKKVKKKKRKNKEDCQEEEEEEEEEENEEKNEICEKPAKKKKKKIEIKKKSKKVKVEMLPTEMVPSLEKYDRSEESDLDQEEEKEEEEERDDEEVQEEEEERDDEEVQEEEEERDDGEVQEEEEEERDDGEVGEEEEEEDSASDGENKVPKPKAPQEETKTKSSEKPRLPFCVKKKDKKPEKDSKQTLQKTSKEKNKKKPKSCEPKSTRCKRYSMREREIVDTGTWVQCTNSECLKWRFLHDVQDPITVPALWTCDMNPDVKQNDCSYSEIQPSKTDIDEFIYTKYTEGTVVWARVDGYPWWPAMVEMDPDSLSYFDIETETSMYPKYYHVVFFGKKVSRAWVTLANISQFVENKPPPVTKGTLRLRTREINEAEKLAVKALEVPINTRLKLFSFSNRYKGFWGDCTCNTCTRAAKSKPAKEDSDEDL